MNLLLASDDALLRSKINSAISIFFPLYSSNTKLAGSALEFEESLSNQVNYDLIVCDINLPGGSIFSILEKMEIEAPSIFLSESENLAFQCFEFNCVDFLIKPSNQARLNRAFEKFLRFSKYQASDLPKDKTPETFPIQSKTSYKKRFLYKSGNRLCFVPVDSVIYFYAEEGVTFLIEAGSTQRHIVDHTLIDLEKNLLDPYKFYRINRSIIINLNFLMEMRPYLNGRLAITLNVKSEDILIVAREKVTDFKVWINQ